VPLFIRSIVVNSSSEPVSQAIEIQLSAFFVSLKPGQKTTLIRLTACEKEHGLLIHVEDDWNGFSEADKESAFKLKRGGENNDLFIIREIITLAGSSLEETGIPGQGAWSEIGSPLSYYRIPAVPPQDISGNAVKKCNYSSDFWKLHGG
jgi:hypothetical protein